VKNRAPTPRQRVARPAFRKLRVFAVDPGLTARYETAIANEMTLLIRWEDLGHGPTGEYIAVVDTDEAGKTLYPPVDLDRADILAQNGLTPSDGDPHFRQQMVYAVAMRTIGNFERALGRVAHWTYGAGAGGDGAGAAGHEAEYRRQLQIHPHWNEDANAFYDPATGRIVCGYFAGFASTPLAGTTVFTCLSQDVVAHEVAHALMLGWSLEFDESTPDAIALHEAFADLIPLFQHFWPGAVLRQQIANIRGDLQQRSTLGALALQFGIAIGRQDGLRNALGWTDEQGTWHPRRPDPGLYRTTIEPHDRGDILIGAVFEAFRTIYDSRVADLRRIATRGSGVMPAGSLHPDLIDRFTQEVSTSARHVLDMCLRALDYLPPVQTTFGDLLRAIITADYDLEPLDALRYRTAFVEAFRAHGIYPPEVGTLSVETLLWSRPDPDEANLLTPFIKELSANHSYWALPRDRGELCRLLIDKRRDVQAFLEKQPRSTRLGPIDLSKPFEVVSFQPRQRSGPSGEITSQWVTKIVQRPGGTGRQLVRRLAGCTLVIDAETGVARYRVDKVAPDATSTARAGRDLLAHAGAPATMQPHERRLRVFAFDPSLGLRQATAGLNEVTVSVAWERDESGRELLEPGPVGEYLEVVDRDPASRCFYEPVDLNHPYLLAQDGLAPSEASPQFHQQMVYAVAMRTIRNFEHALGRPALWAPRPPRDDQGVRRDEEYVQRLRLYPHALREANAYYSPDKKAVLFGYFRAAVESDEVGAGRLTVFTCLSHDIIAHEVTHALLDGMHRRFREASNPDVLAFHEAFADLVALLQHFSLADVLRDQIAATRGDLASQNQLGELAQQLGEAIGKRGALRSALGSVDATSGTWTPLVPDPADYRRLTEPHDRGALLVAAVFDAFVTIYKSRIADLLRIASDGTGVLPAGQLHPDLVVRLANEAARTAERVLQMCIRALDYCPPVDLTFGDYLRAILTGDREYDPADEEHRRVAFVEAFRRRGIIPPEVRNLSVDGLLWRSTSDAPDEDEDVVLDEVRGWASDITAWSLSKSRRALFDLMHDKRRDLHRHIADLARERNVTLSAIDTALPFEVHSIRPSIKTDWEGRLGFQWTIELTQRVRLSLGEGDRAAAPAYFRGGCTLIVDAETGKVRYSIRKPLDDERRERQRQYLLREGGDSLAATYFQGPGREDHEPFAMLHRL
jgi:hypothetical protein